VLAAFGLPIVCIESRQAYQALKSLATHKTDRNDARGLACWPAPDSSSPST
jgi:transposase